MMFLVYQKTLFFRRKKKLKLWYDKRMKVNIETSWKEKIGEYFKREQWKKLADFVRREYLEKTIYPHPKDIFRAFNLCPFEKVNVIILGQDPYHNPGQAHGLSFSVQSGVTPPRPHSRIFTKRLSQIQEG